MFVANLPLNLWSLARARMREKNYLRIVNAYIHTSRVSNSAEQGTSATYALLQAETLFRPYNAPT